MPRDTTVAPIFTGEADELVVFVAPEVAHTIVVLLTDAAMDRGHRHTKPDHATATALLDFASQLAKVAVKAPAVRSTPSRADR